jgi:hypothetical protein
VPITGQILMAVRTVASVSRPRAERLGFVRLGSGAGPRQDQGCLAGVGAGLTGPDDYGAG